MVERHAVDLDRIFSALANPIRREILKGLANGPATINEIAEPFSVSLNAVSRHVMGLERAGLIRRAVQGRQHYCRFEPRPLREAEAWLAHYGRFWAVRLDALEGVLAAKRPKRPARSRGSRR